MRRRIQAFVHATRGIVGFLSSCANAKIQVCAAISIVIAGLVLEFQPWEWIAVVLCIGLVLSAEAMNSALETLADEVSEENRTRIGKAKDMAAGSVLIAAIASVAVASILLVQRI